MNVLLNNSNKSKPITNSDTIPFKIALYGRPGLSSFGISNNSQISFSTKFIKHLEDYHIQGEEVMILSEISKDSILLSPELTKDIQKYKVELAVVMKGDTLEEFSECFRSFYYKNQNRDLMQIVALRIGSMDLNHENLRELYASIYKRLKKINILLEIPNTSGIDLPVLIVSNGPFIMVDKFELMKKDDDLKQIFDKIIKIKKFLLEEELNFRKRFDKVTYKPEFKVFNSENNAIKSMSSNCNTQIPILNKTNLNKEKAKDRLKLKAAALNKAKEIDQIHKEAIIQLLNHNEGTWKTSISGFENLYPSKFMAYLYFEALLNQAHSSFSRYFEGNVHQQMIEMHQARVTAILMECLSILYPYAKDVAQQFGIENDLAADELLQALWQSKDTLTELIDKEIAQYDAYEMQAQELKDAKQSKIKQVIQPQVKEKAQQTINNSSSQAETKSLEDRKIDDLSAELATDVDQESKEEKEPKNSKTKSSHELALAKEAKKQEKEHRLKERHTERASQIFSQHKMELEEEEKVKQAKRIQRISKLHDMPSPEFVEEYIVNPFMQKKGGNSDCFKKVFGELETNKKINHHNILNLAEYICNNILKPHNIGCAEDLLNEVKARIHVRHKDGNALPQPYIAILRSSLIVFGIFPKNWKPQTIEDFDAMAKYLGRCIDKLLFQEKNIETNATKC